MDTAADSPTGLPATKAPHGPFALPRRGQGAGPLELDALALWIDADVLLYMAATASQTSREFDQIVQHLDGCPIAPSHGSDDTSAGGTSTDQCESRWCSMAVDPDLQRVEEELGAARTRLALLNDRRSQIVAALQAARSAGNSETVRALATQLEVVEARRTRAMTIAEAASQRLNQLRCRVQEG